MRNPILTGFKPDPSKMYETRLFLRLVVLLFLSSGLGFAVETNLQVSTSTNVLALAKPTADQVAFMDMELGAFFHFDLNTFTGQEHGDGFEPASKFNPTELDVEQWVRTAKAMGAKYAVLTARHEGGFCLWPTKTTDYGIQNSPYKKGKGDIVREYVNACRKYGLKVGIYHTAAYDAHATYKSVDKGHVVWGKSADVLRAQRFADMGVEGREKYIAMQVAQVTELMTNFGDITYFWCDHYSGSNPIWQAVTKTVKKLQPHCLMMGVDTITPGNELGFVAYPMWNGVYPGAGGSSDIIQLPNNYGLLETDVLVGSPFGKHWQCREVDTSGAIWTGGWFWHPGKKPKNSSNRNVDLYYRSVGMGANLIVNLPPDNRGLIQQDMADTAEKFGEEIKRRFAHPVAERDDIPAGDTVELSWEKPSRINTIITMENIIDGQKVAAYTMEAMVNGKWTSLNPANYFTNAPAAFNQSPGFKTIGHKKIDRIEPVITTRIRFHCIKCVQPPAELRSMLVFNSDPNL